MRSTARTLVVVVSLACGDLAAAPSVETPPPDAAPPPATSPPGELPPSPPPSPAGEPSTLPRLPRLALRGLLGVGVASAAQDVGLVLGAVLDWWPEPWEPLTKGSSSTPWRTSWSFGLTVQRNTFTHYIIGAPPPGVSFTSIVWEPSVDVGTGFYTPRSGSLLGRLSLGAAAYIGTATSTDASMQRVSTNASGGAIRLGFGIIGWPESPVGLAVDWILEGGWIGNSAVGSAQVLIGPSFHLWRP